MANLVKEKHFLQTLEKYKPTYYQSLVSVVGVYGGYRLIKYGFSKLKRQDRARIERIVSVLGIYNMSNQAGSSNDVTAKKGIKLDRKFYQKLVKMIKIIFPGILSKEFAFLSLHSTTLIVRAFLSIYIATLDGRIAKAIVKNDLRRFVYLLVQWLLTAVPASFVNRLLK